MSLAALLLGAASAAQAQVVIGGQNRPRISVDLSVLDQLGPAPTLPQLFLSQFGAPARVATRETRTATARQPTRVATRRPVLHNPNLSLASADLSDSNRRVALTKPGVIHLTPPASRVAAAAPAAAAPVAQNPVAHDQVALTQPTRPSVAALTPPAAAPAAPAKVATAPPAPQDVPAPPALTQAPPHDAPPTAPVQPPVAAVPQSVVRQTPPTPPATSTPTVVTPPAASAPPLQMASAGSAGIAPASVKFAAGATELPSSAQPVLDGLVAKLVANDGLRIQLIAHASGTTDQAIEARRISLARAVAVRAYLIDKGIRSLRVDVRALGNRTDDGVAGDQVDLVVVSQ